MCGIVGYAGSRNAPELLLSALRRLEYRGYDSAGLAVLSPRGTLERVRSGGKLDRLAAKLAETPLLGTWGIGHTRWATHGKPSERNAHPVLDATGQIAVIHNGIIENFLPLKERLEAEGWKFATETDTEVLVNLVASRYRGDLLAAVLCAARELEGMYACAFLSRSDQGPQLVALRQGTPLVLALGDGESFLASDPAALLSETNRFVFLENGEVARLEPGTFEVFDRNGQRRHRTIERLAWDPIQIEKGGYKHFMAKEIHEQPQAVRDTFAGRVDFRTGEVSWPEVNLEEETAKALNRVELVACGTSWHAALVGKFLIEELVGIPVAVDYASEYRYRTPLARSDTLVVGITQSGETIDTLGAMELALQRGARLLALTNVPTSQAARLAHGVLLTHAGPEIGVASTKAFTTQLVALYLLALLLRQQRGAPRELELIQPLAHLPQALQEVLELERPIEELARKLARVSNALFLGRGIHYPIALEGALKLKEISYIHAEGYPAGEMKHGPIALIDENVPVVVLATGERTLAKVRGNLSEVKAREGQTFVVTDRPEEVRELADELLVVPRVPELFLPLVEVVPLQLLAYHVGLRRGCDVDQPRNLAKSVTVE
jgi:glucosamine--fructose-6-phosphate aminotransferase (isomerizing)